MNLLEWRPLQSCLFPLFFNILEFLLIFSSCENRVERPRINKGVRSEKKMCQKPPRQFLWTKTVMLSSAPKERLLAHFLAGPACNFIVSFSHSHIWGSSPCSRKSFPSLAEYVEIDAYLFDHEGPHRGLKDCPTRVRVLASTTSLEWRTRRLSDSNSGAVGIRQLHRSMATVQARRETQSSSRST